MSICFRRREFIAGLGGAAAWSLAVYMHWTAYFVSFIFIPGLIWLVITSMVKWSSFATRLANWPDWQRTAALTILIGTSGFTYTVLDNIRKDHLNYARDQIGHLYGPVCALLNIRTQMWESIKSHTEIGTEEFIKMLETSVVPLNTNISETVIHSQITISDSEIRAAMRRFFRHAEDVKQEIELWKFDGIRPDLIHQENIGKYESFPKELGQVIQNKLKELHINEHLYDNELYGLSPIIYVHETLDDIVSYLEESDPYKTDSIMCATLIDSAQIVKLKTALDKLPTKPSAIAMAIARNNPWSEEYAFELRDALRSSGIDVTHMDYRVPDDPGEVGVIVCLKNTEPSGTTALKNALDAAKIDSSLRACTRNGDWDLWIAPKIRRLDLLEQRVAEL
jgi:hypothetical protein